MGKLMIQFENVTVTYGSHVALDEISLQVPPRTILGIIGPANAGKTTLLKCINRTIDFVDEARVRGQVLVDGQDVMPALIDVLRDGDEGPDVRGGAAWALGEIGPEAKPAVPALIELLEHENDWAREMAAGALGRIGPEAEEAIPMLEQVADKENEDPYVRLAAREALETLGR